MTDFNDPVSRLHLLERVGVEAYNEALLKWIADSQVAVVNGYGIRPVSSRFGQLFMIDGTSTAYPTLEGAKKYASELPETGPLATASAVAPNRTLYHACDRANAESILRDGFSEGSYFAGTEELAEYYAETVSDEGGDPVLLQVELADLITAVGEEALDPDHASIAEPITGSIDRSEDEVIENWTASKRTWRDSLEIVHSIRVNKPIPAEIVYSEELPSPTPSA